MEYRNLGRTGLKVSRLMMGGASFGEVLDEEASRALIHAAWDVGINTFYAADLYGGGSAEETIGKICEPRRDDLVIMTKVGFRAAKQSSAEYNGTPDGVGLDLFRLWRKGVAPTARGLSRKHIMDAVEASLRRLRTDYIDVYRVHLWDYQTPIEETLSALDALINQGKVRYIGIGNDFASWQLYRALWVSDINRFPRFESVQYRYNLVDRRAEAEMLPAAECAQVSITAFNSLAGGLFSGLKSFNERPDGPVADRGDSGMYTDLYWREPHLTYAKQISELAMSMGRHPAELAQGWLLAKPAVTSIQIGPMKPDEVSIQTKSVTNPLTYDELEAIDKIKWSLGRELPRHPFIVTEE